QRWESSVRACCCLLRRRLAGRIRRNRHDLDTGETYFVHNLGHDAGVRRLVGDDHDRVVGSLDMQPLHHRANVSQVDAAAIHPDVAVLANRDHEVARLAAECRLGRRLRDDRTGLLDEGRRDDEEDQKVRREVEHRGQVDARLLGFRRVSSRLHGFTSRYCVVLNVMFWMPPRCTWSTTSTKVPVGARSCARINTPASGFTALMRSTLARTARTSTARLSTQISPFSRIWIWMPLESSSCGCSNDVGRLTSRPASLTKTAVMMKKISRFVTKSSIGARSMPVCS